MIIEGLLTTRNEDGSPRLAPMGPVVDGSMRQFVLRPFVGSATYGNLKRTGRGVFHITDDACLIAKASIGALDRLPELEPMEVDGEPAYRMVSACRWYALRVRSIDDAQPRASLRCAVVDQGMQREFLGFQRARHALIELAILASRVHLLPRDVLSGQMAMLRPLVDKTGDPPEIATWELLEAYIRRHWADQPVPR